MLPSSYVCTWWSVKWALVGICDWPAIILLQSLKKEQTQMSWDENVYISWNLERISHLLSDNVWRSVSRDFLFELFILTAFWLWHHVVNLTRYGSKQRFATYLRNERWEISQQPCKVRICRLWKERSVHFKMAQENRKSTMWNSGSPNRFWKHNKKNQQRDRSSRLHHKIQTSFFFGKFLGSLIFLSL